MRYFGSFPIINYNNVAVRNIAARVKVFERAKQISTLFYPYTIKDGERADTVAYNYYGDSQYFWVVFIVNDIVDPYFEWPMNTRTFESYLRAKYGSVAAAQSKIIKYRVTDASFYLHNTLPSVIISANQYGQLSDAAKSDYTQQNQDDDLFVSLDTHTYLGGANGALEPVYAYDAETDANEARRTIKLLNLDYIPQIEGDLKRLMNQ